MSQRNTFLGTSRSNDLSSARYSGQHIEGKDYLMRTVFCQELCLSNFGCLSGVYTLCNYEDFGISMLFEMEYFCHQVHSVL